MRLKKTVLVFLTMALATWSTAQEEENWTLQECIDFAMENNLDIQETGLQVKTSRVNLRETQFQRYPSLNAGGQYINRWGRSIDPTTNVFTTERISSNGLSFRSSVPVFQGFQINNSIKQDQANLRADRMALEDMENNVKLDIVSGYMDVIFNKALVENAESQVKTTEAQLNLTEKQVAAGALPIANQYEVASQLASDQVNLVTARNDYQLALLNLKQILQIPASEEFAVIEPDIEVEDYNILDYSVAEVYETAEETQPVVKSAEYNVL